MASRSCVSGCGHFLASSDGHDRCPSCLGYQHAEAALVDESCSHCGNMTIAMLRSRYLLAKRVSEGYFGSWSGWFEDHSENFPIEYVSVGLSLLQRIAPSGVPGRTCGVLGQGGDQHLVRSISRWQDVDRCIGGWARFWRWRFGCAASVRKSSVVRIRSRTDCYAFPGHWEHRAALEASAFSRALKAGWLVPGGAGQSLATASDSPNPNSLSYPFPLPLVLHVHMRVRAVPILVLIEG